MMHYRILQVLSLITLTNPAVGFHTATVGGCVRQKIESQMKHCTFVLRMMVNRNSDDSDNEGRRSFLLKSASLVGTSFIAKPADLALAIDASDVSNTPIASSALRRAGALPPSL